MNVTKLPGYVAIELVDINRLLGIAWVFALIPPAVIAARYLIDHISQKAFEWLMMAPLFVLSLYLLLFS